MQILKKDVHFPEIMHDVDISELIDYPPRLLIYVKQSECCSGDSQPEVQVIGLDRECSFELPVLGETIFPTLTIVMIVVVSSPSAATVVCTGEKRGG